MDGIFNINKPTGITSHDVVAKIRKLLKQKRVGHAGTLDPAASGVLPICVGQATRVAEYLSESGKAYQAEIIFGVVTDTYDSEGAILRTADVADLTLSRIEEALPHFLGPQMQLPPRYSAIKIQGQPAYKLARAGEKITLEPRPVVISRLEVIDWLPPRLTLAIECSKGTYIRSLAYDLGEYLGCGAHSGALVRTRSGPFSLSESVTLEQLAEAVALGTVEKYLYPPDKALEQYPALRLDAAASERVLHGNAFKYDGLDELSGGVKPSIARVYDSSGRFLAIAEWSAEQDVWKPKKVLTPPSNPGSTPSGSRN
jgi:tRNA pseudouridine55 synthase